MAERVCAVDECARTDIQGHGWCQMHYYRWRRHGDPTKVLSQRSGFDPGGQCIVEGCDKIAQTIGMCGMHEARFRRHGDPLVLLPEKNLPSGTDHPQWRPDPDVTYGIVHQRLRRYRGPASAYLCVTCGGAAAQWSYDHRDPAERVGEDGLRFSIDPVHYEPKCTSCHKRQDLAVIAARSS